MDLTVAELARAVDKSETYVRQHIHRKHLTARRNGRNVFVALDEAARWARERGLPFGMPARASATAGDMKGRAARMTVLAWHDPDAQSRNLFTLVRHRRQDALGPWASESGEEWSNDDLGHGLRMSSLDATLERCQALVDHIVGCGTLEIDGVEIDYDLYPIPRCTGPIETNVRSPAPPCAVRSSGTVRRSSSTGASGRSLANAGWRQSNLPRTACRLSLRVSGSRSTGFRTGSATS